jgi:hypothetical protein
MNATGAHLLILLIRTSLPFNIPRARLPYGHLAAVLWAIQLMVLLTTTLNQPWWPRLGLSLHICNDQKVEIL